MSALGEMISPSFVVASSVKCDHWFTGASPIESGTVTLVLLWNRRCMFSSGSP